MEVNMISTQWKVICYLAELFSKHGINYQFDGSTAVFIHGVEFEMDDIDIWICADSKEKLSRLLNHFEKTDLLKHDDYMEHCYINIEGISVHVMFIHGKPKFTDETRDIIYDGIKIHTKNIEFYRNHTNKENPLIPLIDDWFNRKQ